MCKETALVLSKSSKMGKNTDDVSPLSQKYGHCSLKWAVVLSNGQKDSFSPFLRKMFVFFKFAQRQLFSSTMLKDKEIGFPLKLAKK